MGRWWAGLATVAFVAGCGDPSCLDGADADCTVAPACASLTVACDNTRTRAEVLDAATLAELPLGPDSIAAVGDILVANDHFWAVIDAPDHPHLLVESGGTVVDMGTWTESGRDGLQQVFQVTGLLPDEAPVYTAFRIEELGDGGHAVQVTGHMKGSDDLFIATRYEVHPCEPGLRVRSEFVNRTPDPWSWTVLDAWWWGGRGLLPFSPHQGGGFTWPEWGLLTLTDGLREVPYMAGALQNAPSAAYGTVPCDRAIVTGLHSTYVSGVGIGPRVAMPRDYEAWERFMIVADGPSVSGATDIALELREQLFGEPWVTLTGRVLAGGAPPAAGAMRASVLVSQGTAGSDVATRTPITQVFPDADGRFSVRVPAGRDVVLTVDALGRQVAEVGATVADVDVDAGDIEIPVLGELTVNVRIDGEEDHALVFVHPADQATYDASVGTTYGSFDTCAPYLGLPHGDSPACNRILVDGPTTVQIVPGTYDLFVSAGPFSTLAVARDVEVTAGEEVARVLDVQMLDLQPEGTLSADFHVHGGPSWDATINDYDRVRAFLAARIDVITSTEHNTAWDYAEALEVLGAADRMQTINGTENTGLVLFDLIPDTLIPKTFGHWNLWPIEFDPTDPYRGSWWDQGGHPGELFNRAAAAGWPASTGVAQLNHPASAALVGRDFGWADTISLDLNRDIEDEFDGTPHSLFNYTPPGSAFSNADFHTTEVMNGTANYDYEAYRPIWWWMLNHGKLVGGTANSDSHTLTENVVGTPRTLVYTDQVVGDGFDVAAFNAAVRDGRMMGTNGPVVEVSLADTSGVLHGPSLTPFTPGPGATLDIEVRAAPWVPVDEIRVVVDGVVVRTITDGIAQPADPVGADPADLDRASLSIPLSELVAPGRDTWIVVEAGQAIPLSADLDCDGIPDTGDIDRNGVVDWRDVDGLDAEPETECFDTVGPRGGYLPPERDTLHWYFQAVTPNGYTASFTNPLVIDGDGDGQFTGVTP